MAGLDPAIHVFSEVIVDARNKSGHDDCCYASSGRYDGIGPR